ncbi:MAG: hypothetical protein CFE44_08415 [Burkholderiales bacterium PBB4]|nr:MAG: hypothetical protein CFE44_08415 [Burkholderiales bacterium PBB4]
MTTSAAKPQFQVTRTCPVCNSPDSTVTHHNAMAAIDGMDMSYTTGRCTHCGFHFAVDLPHEDVYIKYYRSVSKYDVPLAISAVDQMRIQAAVEFCTGKISKDAVLLDVGCGYGAMLAGFKAAGWTQLQGVDPAPLSAQRAKSLFDLDRIYQGTMATVGNAVDLSRIDVVCIMAVLEHLPELRKDLQGLLAQLVPGTKLLVEVPAMELFRAEDSEPLGELSLEHIQFFSTASLSNLMQSLGAQTLASQLVDIPLVKSGSLFGLFEWTGRPAPVSNRLLTDSGTHFEEYLKASARTLEAALQNIPKGPLWVYGAGSHTARLLPMLDAIPGVDVRGIVDGNSNLVHKPMGRWTIDSPDAISNWPDLPILVSSFRSQTEIARSLKSRFPNPLIMLY